MLAEKCFLWLFKSIDERPKQYVVIILRAPCPALLRWGRLEQAQTGGRALGVFIIRPFWFDNPRAGRMIPSTWPECEVGVLRHADGSRSSSEQTFAGGGRAHAYFLLGRESAGGFPVRTDPQ